MSIFNVLKWARRQPKLKSSEHRLLLVLATYANEHGECWPCRETLAMDTGMAKQNVSRALRGLEQARLVVTCGTGKRRKYCLNVGQEAYPAKADVEPIGNHNETQKPNQYETQNYH